MKIPVETGIYSTASGVFFMPKNLAIINVKPNNKAVLNVKPLNNSNRRFMMNSSQTIVSIAKGQPMGLLWYITYPQAFTVNQTVK